MCSEAQSELDLVIEEVKQMNVQSILKPYLIVINRTPELLSLLYDVNMLPEQASTISEALRVAAVVEAFHLGQRLPRGVEI